VHQDPDARRLLDRALVGRFVAVDAHSYDVIRHMLATVRGAGLLPDWWDERWQRIQDA
jgi:hypothetical protein